MKPIYIIILWLATWLWSHSGHGQQVLRGTDKGYQGQNPPGLVPVPFAPGVLSTKGWELPAEFTPGLQEFYLTASHDAPYGPSVIVFRQEGRVWTRHEFYATLSGGVDVLYSKSNYIERTDQGWSEMKSLGPMFDREDWGIMRLSASSNGTYVLDDWKNDDVLRISRIVDGEREEPRLLGPEINTGKWTAHPYIAPDESYLIWDSERPEGYGDSDLYISFRESDGTWGPAINMGDQINTPAQENAAMVTTDGQYLFFGRSEEKYRADGSTYWVGGKYWVDARVIELLRSEK